MAVNTWVGWSLVLAGTLAAGPLVLGRGNPALTPAHEEIARMSEVERTALQRKYDQYRAMHDDQRAALRTLHQQLEADRTSGARSLSTMNDYCDWLKTIDAWQQDELAHIDDPLKKAQRVGEIATDRRKKALANDAAPDEAGAPRIGFGQPPILLTEEQLQKLFDALASRLPPEMQSTYEKEHGLQRIGLQVKALKQELPKLEQLFRAIPEGELREMIEASGNADLMAIITHAGDMPRGDRAMLVKHGIVMSVVAQFVRESMAYTDIELQEFFNSLPKETQDELLQLRAEDFKTALRMRKLAADPVIDELHNLGLEFDAKTFWERLERRRGFMGPGGPGGPNGGGVRPRNPEGDRPPREGDRGGPFNRPNGLRGPGRGDGPPPPRPGDPDGPPPERPAGEDRP